jgi:hypothetical protein
MATKNIAHLKDRRQRIKAQAAKLVEAIDELDRLLPRKAAQRPSRRGDR